MADTDDVPPLEDMTEMLQQVERLREQIGKKDAAQRSKSQKSEQKPNGTTSHSENGVVKDDKPDLLTSKKAEKIVDSKPVSKSGETKGGFGGMKKGFLFGGNSSKSASQKSVTKKQPKTQLDDMTFIKKDENESSSQFALPEVQQAMNQTSALLDNKEWVTDELLENVQKNERLTKRLQDPAFTRAIAEFQTNPQAAAIKYQNNPEFQETFRDFCGIMGNHFSKLGEQQPQSAGVQSSPKVQEIHTKPPGGADMSVRSSTNPNQPTADDERKMQEILSDPEIREILMDPWIQNLFGTIRTDPAKGQRLLQEANASMKKKIQKLVDAGLLQFQR